MIAILEHTQQGVAVQGKVVGQLVYLLEPMHLGVHAQYVSSVGLDFIALATLAILPLVSNQYLVVL